MLAVFAALWVGSKENGPIFNGEIDGEHIIYEEGVFGFGCGGLYSDKTRVKKLNGDIYIFTDSKYKEGLDWQSENRFDPEESLAENISIFSKSLETHCRKSPFTQKIACSKKGKNGKFRPLHHIDAQITYKNLNQEYYNIRTKVFNKLREDMWYKLDKFD